MKSYAVLSKELMGFYFQSDMISYYSDAFWPICLKHVGLEDGFAYKKGHRVSDSAGELLAVRFVFLLSYYLTSASDVVGRHVKTRSITFRIYHNIYTSENKFKTDS